jgi:hypothetical protein
MNTLHDDIWEFVIVSRRNILRMRKISKFSRKSTQNVSYKFYKTSIILNGRFGIGGHHSLVMAGGGVAFQSSKMMMIIH